jgi:hypothetical protein
LLTSTVIGARGALGPALLAFVSEDDIASTFGVALFTVLTMLTLACGTGTGVLVDVLFNEAGSASLAQ